MQKDNPIYKKAIQKSSNYCARAEKCTLEVEKKLHDWGFPEDMIPSVIEYLHENNFINEQRYAIAFANDKFRFNKWGKNKIKAALNQKQISSEYISIAIEEIPEKEYQKIAIYVLKTKLSEIKQKENDAYKIKAKLFNFGQSRGFEMEILNSFFSI